MIHLLLLTAQVAAAATPASVLGVVSEARPGRLSLRTDAGVLVALDTTDSTVVLRSQPGATSLEHAAPLALEEVAVGDRILARGSYSPDRSALVVLRLVVMKKEDVQARLERERADWRRRGVSGVITDLDRSAQQFGVRLRSAGNAPPVFLVVGTAGRSITYRRYAPHSARFSDARPSRFEELAVGDQVRMLGERGADGRGFAADEIVSGAFRTLRGTVLGVDPVLGEIQVRLRNGEARTVVVVVGPEVRPRRMPAASPPESPGRTGVDDVTERWPETSVAEIAIGEEMAVLASRTENDAKVRAIALVAGLLSPAAPERDRGGQERDAEDGGPDMLGSGEDQP